MNHIREAALSKIGNRGDAVTAGARGDGRIPLGRERGSNSKVSNADRI